MQQMNSVELVEWMKEFAKDGFAGYWYLASPYSKYPQGIVAAFEEACRAAAWLIGRGIPIFCPIAESHPIALYGKLDTLDHDIWLANDAPKIEASVGMVICKMETWETSTGILWERDQFRDGKKPTVYLEWPEGRLVRE